ncbi:MAG: excinuclease ABC subunit A [Planctomycetota bacterium]|jgi:excinuclease ABC subunit A
MPYPRSIPKSMANDHSPTSIRIRGARENNLAGVDLDLPLGKWIAVTGPSGSGKTSLVFETLVREGERRFLGSLSTRARHFFGKLGRSDVESLQGLPATIAVGQKATTPSSRSTVGTLTGMLDLLRLAFARLAVDPKGEELTRSHFSFNHPIGQCEECRGLGFEDHVDAEKIVADPTKSLRAGALLPTLKNGYTVYSQVTLEVMDRICQAHGFSVDTVWETLNDEQRDVILYGTRALKVPFGKHPIESRMKWEGITARPREEGYYLGLIPVIQETLKRNRNENILRFVSSAACSACSGTRLGRPGREARLGRFTLPELLAMPASRAIEEWSQIPNTGAWEPLRNPLEERITRLVRLGLGHLSLDRVSTSLSGGEAQRVRLSAQLGAGLSGVLFALDEPTLGLHPESQDGMRAVLDELIEAGNSLIVVEHDPDMVRHADYVVALGPGAGSEGGRVEATDIPGHPQSVERASDPLGRLPQKVKTKRTGSGSLILTGARLNNLAGAKLILELGTLNVITGPSGAGKSSLVFGTLLPALLNTPGGEYDSLTFEKAKHTKSAIQAVDARPIGKTPRSTPATWCGLFDLVRKRFGKLDFSVERKLTASHFSFNNKRGRCQTCEGLGVTRLTLHLFDDVELPCDTCAGGRYVKDVLEVRLRGKNIAEVLALSFRDAAEFFADDADAARLCEAMVTLGLGYLTLGQSSGSLSRGESQRIKLGTLLGSKRKTPTLILLDEPDRGLSPTDVSALLLALDALVDMGHTVVAISHHRQVWSAADNLIEVRDGHTNHEPSVDWEPISQRRPVRDASGTAAERIELRGVRTHNLRAIDVSFPRGQISAVCGVSGSGKSSLVFSTLAGLAEARFAESLPFQVRRFMRRLPQAQVQSANGLTPTLSLRQGNAQVGSRSTIATQSECGPLLRLLFSRAGVLNGKPCGLSAAHFSRERALGACVSCGGKGTLQRCDPVRLITAPEQPLAGKGALQGTRSGRFFSEQDGQYIATLRAALSGRGFDSVDLVTTPWNELSSEVQEIALYGTGATSYSINWELASQVEGSGSHHFQSTWDGFCALVEREAKNRAGSKKAGEWAAALAPKACTSCSGSGLTEAARQTTVLGHNLPSIEDLPIHSIIETLRGEAKGSVQAALNALLPELQDRARELVSLGLGHLNLSRDAASLSRGELQRVRLASVLRSGLSNVTLVLDEPTAGLHESDVDALQSRLRRFRSEGNTIVLVSHRPSVLRAADHLIELGPGAGIEGGTLLAAGTPGEVLAGEGPTARAIQQGLAPFTKHEDANRIEIRGACANNLGGIDFNLPRSGFVCVRGVSGSGKSSLLFDVIAPSFREQRAVNCDSITLPGGYGHFVALHDSRSIANSRSTLAVLNIANDVAALFDGNRIPTRAFKPGDAAGRCPACRGTGRERVAMDFLADLNLPCQICAGKRFLPEVLAVTWRGKSIADLLQEPASVLLQELNALDPKARNQSHAKVAAALLTLEQVAASHIPLGAPLNELSGGEAARVGLTANLLHSGSPALYLFDEPSTGLHEADLAMIVAAFRELGQRGDLVLATEHRESAIAAADSVLTLHMQPTEV